MKKLRCLHSATTGMLLFLLCSSACAITLLPTDDTTGTNVFTGRPPAITRTTVSSASGKSTTLHVSKKFNAFIQFNVGDMSIAPNSVTQARLTLYLPKVSKIGDLTLHLVTNSWTEIFTGPVKPQPESVLTPFLTIPSSNVISKQFIIVDVTDQVKAWLTTSASDHGITIHSLSGIADVLIGAKEGSGSGYPASLEIDVNRGGTPLNGTDGAFSGNVGVGVPTGQNPTAKLDVRGNVAATNFTGPLTGNVTGNVTGSLTGNVTGDITGNVTGNVSGNATSATTAISFSGSLAGDVTGTQGATVIASGAVTSAKLASNLSLGGTTSGTFSGDGSNLTGVPFTIADGSVTNAKLAANAVTSANILDGTVVEADLSTAIQTKLSSIGAGTAPTGTAGGSLAGTYPNPTLASNSVGSAQIADAAVTSEKLASNLTFGGTFTASGDGDMQGNILKNPALGMLLATASFIDGRREGTPDILESDGYRSISTPGIGAYGQLSGGASISLDKPGTFMSANITWNGTVNGHVFYVIRGIPTGGGGLPNEGFGFKGVGTALKGVTIKEGETEVDLGTGANSNLRLLAVRRATSVEFYVNGVLKGSSSTNLPTNGGYVLRVQNNNSVTAPGLALGVGFLTFGNPMN